MDPRSRFAHFGFAVLLAATMARPAAASTLYTIDVNLDILVALDTDTGTRTVVDPTPFWPFSRARHTAHQGLLYEINAVASCFDTQQPYLNTIDPSGPSATGFVNITTGGAATLYSTIGDLTSDGTTMMVSLAPADLSACSNRSLLADLSTDAKFTNVTDFSAFGADMEGLAAYGNALYALDGRGPDGAADLYLVARPATYQLIGTHAMTTGGTYVGMTFSANGELWAMERVGTAGGTLRRLDPTNGQVLASVPILPDASGLLGISAGPAATPTARTSWGRIKTIYR